MTNDDEFIEDLVRTAEESRDAYAKGVEHLTDGDHAELAATFERYRVQRDRFVTQLRGVENKYGDEPTSGESVAATVHRGWEAIKGVVAGSGPAALLASAGQGEDHAIARFEEALAHDLSEKLRSLVELQLEELRLARQTLLELERAQG